MLKLLRNLLPSIAQIMLGFIIIPILAGLAGLFLSTDDMVVFFNSLVSDTPVLGTMTEIITQYISAAGTEQSREQLFGALEALSSDDIVAVCGIGMWSGICVKLGSLIGIKGLPVLQSIAGVLVGSMMTRFVASYGDPLYMMILPGFSVVLNVVLTILTAEKKFTAVFLGIVCEGSAAVFSTAYVALLILVSQGGITNFGVWLTLQLCLMIPMCLFLTVDCWAI